jgi:hypothetical protein
MEKAVRAYAEVLRLVRRLPKDSRGYYAKYARENFVNYREVDPSDSTTLHDLFQRTYTHSLWVLHKVRPSFLHSYIHFSISMNNNDSYHCSIRSMDLPLISWRGYAAFSAMPPNCLLFFPTQRFSNNSCVAPFPFLTVTSFFIYSTINNLQLD